MSNPRLRSCPAADGSEKTSGRPSDQSSADSDLKMELRSTSSLSGRTASERWEDELSSYRYPDDMTEASFPPVRQARGGRMGAFYSDKNKH